MVDELIENLRDTDILYVNPRILKMFIENDPGLTLDNVHCAPCPLESCSIFFYMDGSLTECYVIRKSEPWDEFWLTSVRRDEHSNTADYLNYMEASYQKYYAKIESTQRYSSKLLSKLDAQLNAVLAEKRIRQDSDLGDNKKYDIRNRSEQYELAIEKCLVACSSIKLLTPLSRAIGSNQ